MHSELRPFLNFQLILITFSFFILSQNTTNGTNDGYTNVMSVSEEEQNIIDNVLDEFQSMSGKTKLNMFKGVAFRRQDVAGTNYLFKVKVGDMDYVHLRVFQPMSHLEEPPQLKAFALKKKRSDQMLPDELRSQILIGETSESRHATEYIKRFTKIFKEEYDNLVKRVSPEFEAISFKKQMVAGSIYFIKV